MSAHQGEHVAVVSHKATLRLVLCSLLGFDARGYRDRLDQAPACLNIVDFKDPVRARLMLFNDVSHYADHPGRPRARALEVVGRLPGLIGAKIGRMDRLLRVLALLRDPRTPALPRIAVLLAVLYLIFPLDLLPGSVVPVIGWLDDLTFIWLALRWLVKSAPGTAAVQAPRFGP